MSEQSRILEIMDSVNQEWADKVIKFLKENIDYDELYNIDDESADMYYINSSLTYSFSIHNIPYNISLGDLISMSSVFNKQLFLKTYNQSQIEIIEDGDFIMWNFNALSSNPEITNDFIRKHIHKPWNWKVLTNFKDLDLEIVEKNHTKDWDWSRLSHIGLEFISKHLDKNWNWDCISSNYKSVIEFPDIPWNWNLVVENCKDELDIIMAYPDKNWNKNYISSNPELDLEFVSQNNIPNFYDRNKIGIGRKFQEC